MALKALGFDEFGCLFSLSEGEAELWLMGRAGTRFIHLLMVFWPLRNLLVISQNSLLAPDFRRNFLPCTDQHHTSSLPASVCVHSQVHSRWHVFYYIWLWECHQLWREKQEWRLGGKGEGYIQTCTSSWGSLSSNQSQAFMSSYVNRNKRSCETCLRNKTP